jgi:2-polyprenyl-3-methyl-5-hydroxy-6-metoxy-1,4-benzoquinol methylase
MRREEDAILWHSRMAERFDEQYASKESFAERHKVWTRLIDRYSDPRNRVIDLGCGSGVFALHCAERNGSVVGVDASPEMIDTCTRKMKEKGLENVYFLKTSIESIRQFCLEPADLVICSSVLEYQENLDESLTTVLSLVKHGGLAILSLPNAASIYRKIEPVVFQFTRRPRYYAFVRNVLPLRLVESKLSARGFTITETVYYSKTIFLSAVFRLLGWAEHADNLYAIVARREALRASKMGA